MCTWCQLSRERCPAGSQLQIPSKVHFSMVCMLWALNYWQDGWVGGWMDDCRKELENITWTAAEHKFSDTEHQINSSYFFWHRRPCLGGRTLPLASSVDISSQLHVVTTVVF